MGHFEIQSVLLTFCLFYSPVLSLNPSQPFRHENFLSGDGIDEGQERCQMDCFRNSTNLAELINKNVSLVCGSDGITYLGFEELNCVRRSCGKDIRLLHYGRCPSTQVTGSSHRKHQKAQNQLSRDDDIEQGSEQLIMFPASTAPDSSPVVGDDSKTGRGKYWRGHHQNRNGKVICLPDECNCPKEFRPVCGSDSVTYGNECLMECNKKCKPDVVKFREGHCGKPFGKAGCISSPDDCSCPDDESNLQPVCGTDNVTYWNRCLLECNRNCSPNLEFNHSGYCGRVFFPALSQ